MRRALLVATAVGVGVSAWYFWRSIEEAPAFALAPGFAPFQPASIGVAVALVLAAHGLRAVNSGLLVDTVRRAPRMLIVRALAYGYLCNTLLPVRLGELVRAFYLGSRLRVARTVMLLTVVLERAVDCVLLAAATFVTTAVAGPALVPAAARAAHLFAGTILLVGVILLGLVELLHRENRRVLALVGDLSSIFNERIKNRIRYVVWCLVLGSHALFKRAPWPRFLAGAVASWGLYLAALLPLAVDATRSAVTAPFVAAASYVSVFVPAGPGYFGTFQFALSRFLQGAGGGPAVAFAYSIVAWLVFTVPITLAAVLLLSTERTGPRALVEVTGDPRLDKLLRLEDLSSEFDRFLDGYFSGRGLARVLSQFETKGHLRLVRSLKGGSHAVTNVFADGTHRYFVRKSTLLHEAPKLRAQYRWLADRQHLPHLPKLLQEVEGPDSYSFDLEYLADHRPLFDIVHSGTVEDGKALLGAIITFVSREIHGEPKPVIARSELEAYLRDKVQEKVKTTVLLAPSLQPLVEAETLVVNGVTYPNLHRLLGQIRASERILDELSRVHLAPLHGDLTVDNVMVRGSDFVLIDPNDENAVSDPLVDFGKLFQSLHSGYEFLCRLEGARVEGNVITFDEAYSARYAEVFAHLDAHFRSTLSKERHRAIYFHEAVHYCRLLPYRVSLCEATVPCFYAVAVRLFDQFLRMANEDVAAPDLRPASPRELV